MLSFTLSPSLSLSFTQRHTRFQAERGTRAEWDCAERIPYAICALCVFSVCISSFYVLWCALQAICILSKLCSLCSRFCRLLCRFLRPLCRLCRLSSSSSSSYSAGCAHLTPQAAAAHISTHPCTSRRKETYIHTQTHARAHTYLQPWVDATSRHPCIEVCPPRFPAPYSPELLLQ